jgi:hypothetical protein
MLIPSVRAMIAAGSSAARANRTVARSWRACCSCPLTRSVCGYLLGWLGARRRRLSTPCIQASQVVRCREAVAGAGDLEADGRVAAVDVCRQQARCGRHGSGGAPTRRRAGSLPPCRLPDREPACAPISTPDTSDRGSRPGTACWGVRRKCRGPVVFAGRAPARLRHAQPDEGTGW